MDFKLYLRCLIFISVGGIVPSMIATGASLAKPEYNFVMLVTLLANAVFIVWLVRWLVGFRMHRSTLKKYYLHNITAMATYCAVSGITALIVKLTAQGDESVLSYVHTFLFYNFKAFHYHSFDLNTGNYRFGTVYSTALCAAVYMLIVAVVPLFINKKRLLHIKRRRK